ncbi:MAG: CobW family GTP-binding protein [Lachnospiraceae bacterium]|nr:CobW family GTP-binding protein [Lachnospiraceae bacterium]
MVKISIISGFLGAGKTTFIRKLLQEKYFGSAPVLIENDYGSLGIDSLVMENTGVQVREITSGCICCSLIGNFVLALEELIEKQHPEHIIIEPSGVGKLSEILEALNDLEVPFEKHLVLTIVDAKRFYYNNQYVSEYFWDQISNADAVILSKTKRMSGKELSGLCNSIHNKISDMEIICVPWDMDYHPILDELLCSQPAGSLNHCRLTEKDSASSGFSVSPGVSVPQHMLPTRALSRKNSQTRSGASPFFFPGTKRKQGSVFESWSTETCLEYSNTRLNEIIDALNQNRYGAIVRAKGVLNNPQGSVLLDYVPGEGKISSISQEETGRLLVIGMNLNRLALERLFLT